MPLRPPAAWMNRCQAGVRASGSGARDVGAVCGATWWRKPERERAFITRMEEGMAKKKKKKGTKRKGTAKRSAARSSRPWRD